MECGIFPIRVAMIFLWKEFYGDNELNTIMKFIDRDDISAIFVGRKKILTRLQKRLNLKNKQFMKDRPHFVYTLLNTPGIGKTNILYSPQGFGWNFEVLTKYGLLGPMREMAVSKDFPLEFSEQFGKFKEWQKEWGIAVPDTYEKIMGDYDLSKIKELPEKTYIMLPETTGIDAIIKEEDNIIIIQITSGQEDYISRKFKKFKTYLARNFQNSTKKIIF